MRPIAFFRGLLMFLASIANGPDCLAHILALVIAGAIKKIYAFFCCLRRASLIFAGKDIIELLA